MTDQVTNRGHPKENGEIFVDIPGYEGDYQISNYGNVRSLKKIPYFILKPMIATNGYLTACLWKNGKQRKIGIHRLVAEAFIENPGNLEDVNHRDEDKQNNRVENLEWCTHKYNMNYGSVREKIGRSNTGKRRSPEELQRLAKSSTGRRWVNNGHDEKFVTPETMITFVNIGWQTGRLARQ